MYNIHVGMNNLKYKKIVEIPYTASQISALSSNNTKFGIVNEAPNINTQITNK